MKKNITKKDIISAADNFFNSNGDKYTVLYINKTLNRTLLMNCVGSFIGAWHLNAEHLYNDDFTGDWDQGHYFMKDLKAATAWVLGDD